MKRKTCKQSKDSNPNWLEKMEVELSERFVRDQVEVFLSGSPRGMKFSDKQILGDNKILGYSCEGLIGSK